MQKKKPNQSKFFVDLLMMALEYPSGIITFHPEPKPIAIEPLDQSYMEYASDPVIWEGCRLSGEDLFPEGGVTNG